MQDDASGFHRGLLKAFRIIEKTAEIGLWFAVPTIVGLALSVSPIFD